jgi:hypothetical protein
MKLLEEIEVEHQSRIRRLGLYLGDLAAVPPEESFDLLVISAFPDDYTPTPTSLIGSLYRRGLSIAELAKAKEIDLRYCFACWLSKDLTSLQLGFKRILCFEPSRAREAPSIVQDVFRSIMPFVLLEPPIKSIGLPILASGDQGHGKRLMLDLLATAAVQWLRKGLPVERIKIVALPDGQAVSLPKHFPDMTPVPSLRRRNSTKRTYDYFISYSREDQAAADAIVGFLTTLDPHVEIYQDKLAIRTGLSWQADIDRALEACAKVIPLYSPAYLNSRICMEEFNLSRLRHRESEFGVLFPIYLRSASLPLYMQSINYFDCRESDMGKLQAACEALISLR